MYRFIWSLCVNFVLLSGCAINPTGGFSGYIPLEISNRDQIKTAVILVGQNPSNSDTLVQYNIQNNQPQAGGLIGALIGSWISSSIIGSQEDTRQRQQGFLEPFRNKLVEYNYGSQFREEVARKFQSENRFSVLEVRKEPGFVASNIARYRDEFKCDAIIALDTYYELNNELNRFTIIADVSVIPLNPQLKTVSGPELERPIFHNKYTYIFNQSKSELPPNIWIEDNRIVTALNLAKVMIIDFAYKDINGVLNIQKYKLDTIDESHKRTIIQENNGEIFITSEITKI